MWVATTSNPHIWLEGLWTNSIEVLTLRSAHYINCLCLRWCNNVVEGRSLLTGLLMGQYWKGCGFRVWYNSLQWQLEEEKKDEQLKFEHKVWNLSFNGCCYPTIFFTIFGSHCHSNRLSLPLYWDKHRDDGYKMFFFFLSLSFFFSLHHVCMRQFHVDHI